MTSAYTSRGISVVLLFIFHYFMLVEAFGSNPVGLRRMQSPWTVNGAKKEFEGVAKLEGRHRRIYEEDDGNSLRSSDAMPHRTSRTGTWKTSIGMGPTRKEQQQQQQQQQWSRDQFLTFGLAASAAASWSLLPDAANAKLYSENAANMERINNGDFSGGSVFDNNPTNERAKKRRAMTGCKVGMSREEASLAILKRNKVISEKECNTMVMDGDTEFMLQALRNLDCPTCANGIGRVN